MTRHEEKNETKKIKEGISGVRTAKNTGAVVLTAAVLLMLTNGCSKPFPVSTSHEISSLEKKLSRIGYTIQVGAFSNVQNAVGLMENLREQGITAYYFRHQTGLFKVRFGEYTSRREAEKEALDLTFRKIIDEFYIVSPGKTAPAKTEASGEAAIRKSLVQTAEKYKGLPYCWGGDSVDEGFDCSGLASAVYRLHGLSLPRTAQSQYEAGVPVSLNRIQPGDLVFFSMSSGRGVTHVGIYIGGGRFIHAPSNRKSIRINSLNNPYYRRRFAGARRYIYLSLSKTPYRLDSGGRPRFSLEMSHSR